MGALVVLPAPATAGGQAGPTPATQAAAAHPTQPINCNTAGEANQGSPRFEQQQRPQEKRGHDAVQITTEVDNEGANRQLQSWGFVDCGRFTFYGKEMVTYVLDLPACEVVSIHNVESTQPVRAYSRIGQRTPAHCVATGKALLAAQPPEALAALPPELAKFTPAVATYRERYGVN